MSLRPSLSSTVTAPTAIKSDEAKIRLRSGFALRMASVASTAPGVVQWPVIEDTSWMFLYLAISSWKPRSSDVQVRIFRHANGGLAGVWHDGDLPFFCLDVHNVFGILKTLKDVWSSDFLLPDASVN